MHDGMLKCQRHKDQWGDIEGYQPEWCISSMIYSRDIPFWSKILDMYLDKATVYTETNTRYMHMSDYLLYHSKTTACIHWFTPCPSAHNHTYTHRPILHTLAHNHNIHTYIHALAYPSYYSTQSQHTYTHWPVLHTIAHSHNIHTHTGLSFIL